MNIQKILFWCCLVGGQLLAMEEKPSQALAVKKPGEVGALADAEFSHLGFWGKTGVAVGAVGGLATLGIGAGLFFAPKADRDLGYKERVTKVLARMGALVPFGARRQSRACSENAESSLVAADRLTGCDETVSAATSVRQNADSQSKAAAETNRATGGSVLRSLCDEEISQEEKPQALAKSSVAGGVRAIGGCDSTADSFLAMERVCNSVCGDHSIGGYQRGVVEAMGRRVEKEEVLALLRQFLANIEKISGDPSFIDAYRKKVRRDPNVERVCGTFQRDLSVLSDSKVEPLVNVLALVKKIYCRNSVQEFRTDFAELMQRDVKEADVFSLLKECVDGMEAVKQSRHYADIVDMCDLSPREVDAKLTHFRRMLEVLSDFGAASLLGVIATAQKIRDCVFDGFSIERYQEVFAEVLKRDVREDEVLGLLKKYIDDLEAAKRTGVSERAGNASEVDALINSFRQDLKMLSDPKAFSLVNAINAALKVYDFVHKDHSVEGYRRYFLTVMPRPVEKEDVPALLKKCIDDLHLAMRSPCFTEALAQLQLTKQKVRGMRDVLLHDYFYAFRE